MNKKNILLLLVLIFCLAGCEYLISPDEDTFVESTVEEPPDDEVESTGELQDSSKVAVHFINVGQGDCIFINSPDGSIIIDAGENATEQRVVDYIKSQGVTSLDYVVATHPHSDHIAGLDVVINNFDVKNVFMPQVTHTTVTFERLVKAISNKRLKATKPVVGDKFNIGEMEFVIIAPNSENYDNLNNYSIGLKMNYGEHSFILTADAEKLAENEMLENGVDLKSQFFKLGHHGSYTSNSADFLDAISPKIAIISLGLDNDYGHPHKEVMERLEERNIEYYRTDELGDIVIETDGKNYEISYSNDDPLPIVEEDIYEEEVGGEEEFVDENGQGTIKGNVNSKGEKIYHMPGNTNYDKTNAEEYFKTEQEAEEAGFRKAKR